MFCCCGHPRNEIRLKKEPQLLVLLRDWLNLVSLQPVISQEVSVQDHLWKSIFWTMPVLLEVNKTRKTLTIIISLENVIKSFNLYEDYQLSQQHEFHEHSCGTGWKGRTPSLSVAVGLQPSPTHSGDDLQWWFCLVSHWLHTRGQTTCLCPLPEFPAHSGYLWRMKAMSCLEPGKISAWKWQILDFALHKKAPIL